VLDTASRTVRYDSDLRPFFANNEGKNGGVGGTFPFGVAVKGNTIAYVSSDRDREVVVVDISSLTSGRLVKRIELDGNALGMTLDASGSRLYVAEDNADQVAVIDTASNLVVAKIDARAPAGILAGSHGAPSSGRTQIRSTACPSLRGQSHLTNRTSAPDTQTHPFGGEPERAGRDTGA
jgi:YVTN family beta-propeller protein